MRLDRTITPHQNIYARYSYKQRSVASPPTNSATAGGSALTGTFNKPEKDTSLAVSYNYVITPALLNELRGGLSKFITETTFADNSAEFTSLRDHGDSEPDQSNDSGLSQCTYNGVYGSWRYGVFEGKQQHISDYRQPYLVAEAAYD